MGDVEYDGETPDDMILFSQPTSQEIRKMHLRRTRRKRTTVTQFPFESVLNGVAMCPVVSVHSTCKFQQTFPIWERVLDETPSTYSGEPLGGEDTGKLSQKYFDQLDPTSTAADCRK